MAEPRIRIITGPVLYINDNHRPCRETRTIWYRHDKVVLNDKELDGFIQVKERQICKNRTQCETSTCYNGMAVVGRDVNWLIRQNLAKVNQ